MLFYIVTWTLLNENIGILNKPVKKMEASILFTGFFFNALFPYA